MEKRKQYIISLGGSLIFPREIDVKFLSNFKDVITNYVGRGNKFGIICGGGWIAREYQRSCESLKYVSSDAKDRLGIEATKMNALFLKEIFPEDVVYSSIVKDPTTKISTQKPIIIASGWKPGWSSDFVAVSLAENLGIESVINMSNTDGVYDSDPGKNPSAKKIEQLSWETYRSLIPSEWRPGMSTPFDPIASKKAQELKMTVYVINSGLSNLENLINGMNFEGSTIQPDN